MNEYINEFDLLNPTLADIVSENCPLVSLTAYQVSTLLGLSQIFDGHGNDALKNSCLLYIKDGFSGTKGLYYQYPVKYTEGILNEKDKVTSPDQLIVIMLWFHVSGQHSKNKEIAWYLVKHFGTYNNLTGKTDFDRMMQAKVLFLAGYLGISKILFYIPLMIASHMSLNGDTNSGIQKAFLILSVLHLRNGRKLLTKVKDNLLGYYKEENQPIRKMLMTMPK